MGVRVGFRQRFNPDFVIDLLLAENAEAYYYRDVADGAIVNDILDDIPIFIWAGDNYFHAYARQIDEQTFFCKP